MDNVHFSLDNYDLPLCNLLRMALMAQIAVRICVCLRARVYLLQSKRFSFRFIYGAVYETNGRFTVYLRLCQQCGTKKNKRKNSTRKARDP